jgi:hypothetical protein
VIRIGLVDPETSHARAFTEWLKQSGRAEVTAMICTENIRSRKVFEAFSKEFSIPIYPDLDSLCEVIDGAFVLSVDWNSHVTYAKQLLANGKRAVIDKPICGSVREIQSLSDLRRESPGMLFGGSAIPYTKAFQDIMLGLRSRTGKFIEVDIAGPGDDFFLGIHSLEITAALFTWGDDSLVHSSASNIEIRESDKIVRVHSGGDNWNVEVRHAGDITHTLISTTGIYDGYLDAMTNALSGNPTTDYFESALLAVRFAIAAQESKRISAPITLSELPINSSIPSEAFIKQYRETNFDRPL